jgi:cyclase
MLLKRLIGCILVRNGLAVQSVGFARYRPLGRPEIAAAYLDRWGIDEIALLDIAAHGRGPDLALVGRIAAHCRVPLTVGGGIDSLDTMRAALRHGADKVALNTAALLTPGLIAEGAAAFGRQCIVASIDAAPDGTVFNRHPDSPTSLGVLDHAARCAERGAGEIMVNAVDRDGAGQGYDLGLMRAVCAAVPVPVIAVGGAGHPDHVAMLLSETPAAAAGVANLFSHTEHSVTVLKAKLRADGVPVRIDSFFTYDGFGHGPDGRLARLPDAVLAERFYEVVERDAI